MMNERGKSDRPVVPVKSSNKAGQPAAEGMEGRGLTYRGLFGAPQLHRSPVFPLTEVDSGLGPTQSGSVAIVCYAWDSRSGFKTLVTHIYSLFWPSFRS
jgi:hypothetical protein